MKNSNNVFDPIKGSVRRLYDAQRRMKQVKDQTEKIKQKEQLCISNFMFSRLPSGVNSFELTLDEGEHYCASPETVRVTRVRKTKLIWDFPKLRKNIGKQRFQTVVKKTYAIQNMEQLVNYLKSCGVDPNKFKSFVQVDYTMDEERLDQYLNMGDIKPDEIAGCYETKFGEPYIRITPKSF